MDNKVVPHIQKLRGAMHNPKEHSSILADMFLEEGIVCHVEEIQWDTYLRQKITLKIEVFP